MPDPHDPAHDDVWTVHDRLELIAHFARTVDRASRALVAEMRRTGLPPTRGDAGRLAEALVAVADLAGHYPAGSGLTDDAVARTVDTLLAGAYRDGDAS